MRIIFLFIFSLIAVVGLALAPATVTITNLRDEAVSDVSSVEFMRGYKLAFTNCIAYSGISTSSARENLTGVTLTLYVGWPYSNISYTATAQNATNGIWNCLITVPTNWVTPFIQLKLTDTATNIFIYPLKRLKTIEPIE